MTSISSTAKTGVRVPAKKYPSARLSRASPEPLYRQLAGLLEQAIRDGGLKPGDRLESESVLMQTHGVSRITLRQAVELLVKKQLLVRKQGKGTFVTAPAVRHDLRRLHGLLGSLFSQADGASARLLHYELRTPPADIAAELGLKAGDDAMSVDRLYFIDGKPVVLCSGWLVPEVAAVPRARAELISTEDMMLRVGIRIGSTKVGIRAESAGARIGQLLRLSSRAPVLFLHRVAFGTDGRPKEIGHLWFRSDSYQFVCSTEQTASTGALFDIRNVAEQV